MAERMYKINEAIDIIYQAPNKESGLNNVVAEIILPDGSQNSNFLDVTLVEILGKGIYKGQFTPDQVGDWEAICHKSDGDGQVVKRYSVGSHNVHSIGGAIGDIDADVAALDAKADTTHTKLDNLDTKVGSLDTPPMVS